METADAQHSAGTPFKEHLMKGVRCMSSALDSSTAVTQEQHIEQNVTNVQSAHAIIFPVTTGPLILESYISSLSLRTATIYPAPNPVLILLSERGFNSSAMGSSYKPVVNPNAVLITHSTL